MNKNAISETVSSCKKQIERPDDGLGSFNSLALPEDMTARQLIWSSRKADDWEILVYKKGESWEACFFRWPIHHEHAAGPSFDSVRQRAEHRIQVLQARRLRTTEWRQPTY